MASISASVGRRCPNRATDVLIVQELLNRNIARMSPMRPVKVSGFCDVRTIELIEEFQRRVLHDDTPDGRVDPGGRTLAVLTAHAAVPDAKLEGVELDAPAARVLQDVLKSLGITTATISGGARTPADQARIMYENCEQHGAAHGKRLYGAAGDKVIDVYVANKGKAREEVIELMRKKIVELGPARISRHLSETHYTFDIDPRSIPESKHKAFADALRANRSISKVITPPADPAFHIEIPKKTRKP